jgi:aryl-alcohol dehydrogenase-like predicted oxidoreductase
MSERKSAMPYGRIPGVEQPVARLVMGAMPLSTRDMRSSCELLDAYIALGGNAIDTAYEYGEERERAVGQWMRQRGNRSQMVVIGKGAHHDEYGPRINPEAIAADLMGSLERLETDYLDLFLLHRDDPTVAAGEIVEWLNEHHRAGRIRAFGGSNWTTARLQEANDYARAHGLVPFAAGSPNFSLAVMLEPPWKDCLSASVEGKEWYQEHQFPLLAWSSQAQGFFTDRTTPDTHSDEPMVRSWYSAENFARKVRAEELGRRKGVSATAIAVAYVLFQPFPTFALVGPQTADELQSSAQALKVTLTPDELRWLNLEDA